MGGRSCGSTGGKIFCKHMQVCCGKVQRVAHPLYLIRPCRGQDAALSQMLQAGKEDRVQGLHLLFNDRLILHKSSHHQLRQLGVILQDRHRVIDRVGHQDRGKLPTRAPKMPASQLLVKLHFARLPSPLRQDHRSGCSGSGTSIVREMVTLAVWSCGHDGPALLPACEVASLWRQVFGQKTWT